MGMAKNLIVVTVGFLCWFIIGWPLAYGDGKGNKFAGGSNFLTDGFVTENDAWYMVGYRNWFFQGAFCATGGTIVSGAMAERTQLKGFIIYVIAMTTIIYPIVVYWGWSGSGFLNYVDEECDAQYIALGGCSIVGPKLYDFAGSGIVHMVGGVAALCGSAIVGPRNGRFDDNAGESFDAHNMPFTVFAPTNDGFAALPEGTVDTLLKPENKDTLVDILTYHVLGSEVLSTDLKFFQRVKAVESKSVHVYKTREGVFVSPDGKDFRTVVGADNMASNGVAHIIDGVLLPPTSEVVV